MPFVEEIAQPGGSHLPESAADDAAMRRRVASGRRQLTRRSVTRPLTAAGLALVASGAASIYAERARAHGPRVHATFNLADPDGGPFPSKNW
jgi:hypothetical protein